MFLKKMSLFILLSSIYSMYGEVKNMNNYSFKDLVNLSISNSKPLILDFYSESCPPCRKMKPILEEISNSRENQYLFGKIDVDVARELSNDLNILSIPTFIIFNNGKVIGRFTGSSSKSTFTKRINDIIKNGKN